MWQELVTELSRGGLPIGNYSSVEALGQPAEPPPNCVGSYLNGDIEYSVTVENGDVRLAIDGEAVARLTFHEGLTFAQQDPTSGLSMHPGRFLPDPTTGDLDLIQVGGRLGRRRGSLGREG